MTPEERQHLEEEAAKLNLSISAFIFHLMHRQSASVGADRFDRMVREIFGKYGTVMRNLAK